MSRCSPGRINRRRNSLIDSSFHCFSKALVQLIVEVKILAVNLFEFRSKVFGKLKLKISKLLLWRETFLLPEQHGNRRNNMHCLTHQASPNTHPSWVETRISEGT